GGAIALIAIVVVVILLISGGSSKKNSSANTAAGAPTTTTSRSATATPQPVAQGNLTSPTAGSKTKGAAVVVKQGTTTQDDLIQPRCRGPSQQEPPRARVAPELLPLRDRHPRAGGLRLEHDLGDRLVEHALERRALDFLLPAPPPRRLGGQQLEVKPNRTPLL